MVSVVVPRTYFSTPQTLNGAIIQTKFKDEKMRDGCIMPGLSIAGQVWDLYLSHADSEVAEVAGLFILLFPHKIYLLIS